MAARSLSFLLAGLSIAQRIMQPDRPEDARRFFATKKRWMRAVHAPLAFDVSFHALCLSVHSPTRNAGDGTQWIFLRA